MPYLSVLDMRLFCCITNVYVYVCLHVNVSLFACVLHRTKVVPIKYKQLAVNLHAIQFMRLYVLATVCVCVSGDVK